MSEINLAQDFASIYEHLKQRVETYSAQENAGPGNPIDPVTQLTFGYEFEQSGFYALVIDTRPGATPDGEWNSFIEANEVSVNHWFEALDHLAEEEEPVTVTRPDGSSSEISEYDAEEIAQVFGEIFQQVLTKARSEGLLERLPLAAHCTMGVEHCEGAWGWPAYEEKDTVGRANL